MDPHPSVGWKNVKQAALDLKIILDQLKLESFLKVSGNKGLHIHVPIIEKYSWDKIKNFSKSICMQLVADYPKLYTVNLLKKDRKNKIFLDCLRNGYGATAILPYSLRNNPLASIALPIAWDELSQLKGPDIFTLKNVTKRLKRTNDPWSEYFKVRQGIHILDTARRRKE